jgi:S1-C subfamily serine protease
MSLLGCGVIVDAERGLVVTDRNTVPHSLGDVMLIFGGSVRLKGKVVFVHPIHNFAVLSYDVSRFLPESDFRSIELSDEPLKRGDDVTLVGLSITASNSSQTAMTLVISSKVVTTQEILIERSNPPQYRAINMDGIQLENTHVQCIGGILVDKGTGRMQALWASFLLPESDTKDETARDLFRGIPVHHLLPVIEPLRSGRVPSLRSLQVEFQPITLADARSRGLNEERVKEIQDSHSSRHQVLMIVSMIQGASAASHLQVADLVVSVNGHPVCTFWEVEELTQSVDIVDEMVVIRDGAECHLRNVPTDLMHGVRTSSFIVWVGALFQEPHREVLSGSGEERPQGVYISRYYYGSPAQKYSLLAAHWITEINEMPTPTMTELQNVIKRVSGEPFVRIKIVSRNLQPIVLTLKPDYHYWPTFVLSFNQEVGEWQGVDL